MRKDFDEDSILNLDFGGKCMLIIGEFLQLLSSGRMVFEHLTPTDTWRLFNLHELTEIVRQNKMRVGKQTQSDIAAIHVMADTDVSHWPGNHFRSYMTNHLVGKRNMEVMNNVTNTVFAIHAVDRRADGHTGAFQYNLSDYIDIAKAGNLKKIVKLWIGAKIQLINNLDVEDKLCNRSEGTVKYIHICNTTCSAKDGGAIYVQFDNKKSGNKRKSHSYPEELQCSAPILGKTRKLPYSLHGKHKKSNLTLCERKQFPIALAHATTIHKTKGSTIDHMTEDLAITTKGGKHPCPILQGLVYTLLSRAKRLVIIGILNFHEDKIKHKKPLKEIERMRRDCPFANEHPLENLHDNKICLNNIRGWQAHISHFLSDKCCTKYSSVLCFNETKVDDSSISNTSEHQPG